MMEQFGRSCIRARGRPRSQPGAGRIARSNRRGFTCVEIAALQFVLLVTLFVSWRAAHGFGTKAGIAAGVIAFTLTCLMVRWFYAWAERRFPRRR